jgi:hypothetical protein
MLTTVLQAWTNLIEVPIGEDDLGEMLAELGKLSVQATNIVKVLNLPGTVGPVRVAGFHLPSTPSWAGRRETQACDKAPEADAVFSACDCLITNS